MAGANNLPIYSKQSSRKPLRSLILAALYFIVALGVLTGIVFLFRRDSSKNKNSNGQQDVSDNNQGLHLYSKADVANSRKGDEQGDNNKLVPLVKSHMSEMTFYQKTANDAPIQVATDEFKLISDYTCNANPDSAVLRGINVASVPTDGIMSVCLSKNSKVVLQSMNITSSSLYPQLYGKQITFANAIDIAISPIYQVNRYIRGLSTNVVISARQLELDSTAYYLPEFNIQSNTASNIMMCSNVIADKEYIEAFWGISENYFHSRIDLYDDSVSGKTQVNIQSSAFGLISIIYGASFDNGLYGAVYPYYPATGTMDCRARFFASDDTPIGTELVISTTNCWYEGHETPFLIHVGDYAVAGWIQKQTTPPYPMGGVMRILDYKMGTIVAGDPVPVFTEDQGKSDYCAAATANDGAFIVACMLADSNIYLKMFVIDNGNIQEVPNSKLQVNQNPIYDARAINVRLLSNGLVLVGFLNSSQYFTGRIFATKAFAPEWSDPGFKLKITRGECSEVKYDCSSVDSCIQATLVAGDARTITATINSAPHLQLKDNDQAVSEVTIGDVQDNKVTVCHDGTAIGTPPEISANMTLSWYSTIDGKMVYSNPKLAAMTVTNTPPVIVIPAHALDVEQGKTLEKELEQYYSDFDGDALAQVVCNDLSGGVCEIWVEVYKNNGKWYLKLSPGHGVTTGDKSFILTYTDARGAETKQTTVTNVYKPSNTGTDSTDGGVKWTVFIPFMATGTGSAISVIVCCSTTSFGIFTLCFGLFTSVLKSERDRRKIISKARDSHRLAMEILSASGFIEPGFANLDRGTGQTVAGFIEGLLKEKYGKDFLEDITLDKIKKVKAEIVPTLTKIRRKRASAIYWLLGETLSAMTCGCFHSGVALRGFDRFLEKYENEIRKGIGLPPKQEVYELEENRSVSGSEMSDPLLPSGSEVDESEIASRDGSVTQGHGIFDNGQKPSLIIDITDGAITKQETDTTLLLPGNHV